MSKVERMIAVWSRLPYGSTITSMRPMTTRTPVASCSVEVMSGAATSNNARHTSVLDMYSRPLQNASGNYLTSPIIHSQGGVYLGTVVGAKTLHRGISGDAAWWQYGDDIVLNGGRTQSDINYFRNCLLLPDAAAA